MGATPGFDRYIGIDYSGARPPTSSLRGDGQGNQAGQSK
jgi:hypothetical protein